MDGEERHRLPRLVCSIPWHVVGIAHSAFAAVSSRPFGGRVTPGSIVAAVRSCTFCYHYGGCSIAVDGSSQGGALQSCSVHGEFTASRPSPMFVREPPPALASIDRPFDVHIACTDHPLSWILSIRLTIGLLGDSIANRAKHPRSLRVDSNYANFSTMSRSGPVAVGSLRRRPIHEIVVA